MAPLFAGLAGALIIAAAPMALQSGAEASIERIAPEPVDPSLVTDLDEQANIIASAATALSSVETARGRFTQVAPDFSITEGDFALRRPGRVRFDYDDPAPLLIIADGSTVAIEDTDLETVDRVPLSATPLGIILDDRIDFGSEAEVVEVRRANGFAAISVSDPEGETDGVLTLVFDDSTYDLLMWRTIDGNGGVTSVELAQVETDIRLNPRLFRIEDPADRRDERRR